MWIVVFQRVFPAKTLRLVSYKYSLYLVLYAKPNRRWCPYVF